MAKCDGLVSRTAVLLIGFRIKHDISVPTAAKFAVVDGAVRYAIRPQEISSRISARTYGMRYVTRWEEGMPKEGRSGNRLTGYKSRDGFKVMVTRGESVSVSCN